ncbi:MAG: hypothetical protein NTY19_08270, partial [Planctomycetota bacterium]|nr:hypothetical protein [Planctomycetota bacterium]
MTRPPDHVSDGAWHHCAATFDGQFMRVYLDSKEIQALERPGVGRGKLGSRASNGWSCFRSAPIRACPEWHEVKRNLRSPLGLPRWTRGLKTKAAYRN